MKNLLLLLKVDILRILSFNKFKNNIDNKNKLKTLGIVLLALFIISSVLITIGSYTYLGLNFLKKANVEYMILPMIYLLVTVSIFFTTVNRSKTHLFTLDENIFAMPIKSSTILLSRLISLIILSFVVTTLVYIPSFLVYGITMGVTLKFYLFVFMLYLFTPILPTILGSIFGYIIGMLTAKFKNKKVFETLFTFFITFAIMYVSFNIQSIGRVFIKNVDTLNDLLNKTGFLINNFFNALYTYSLSDLGIFAFVNVISILIFLVVFNKPYVKIIQNLKVQFVSNKYIEKEHKNNSVLTALVIKEIKTYLSIPVYILNTSFGVIILLVTSIASIFYDKASLISMLSNNSEFSLSIDLMIFGMIFFCIVLSSTTVCSISLEGKNFWIVKSMPIKSSKILLSKIILNNIVVLPISFISIVILKFTFDLSIKYTLLLILTAIFANFASSMFGLIANLKFPRLDYISYVHAVKQSFSSFVGVIVPMIFCYIILGLSFVVKLSTVEYILVILTLLLGIIMLQYIVLKKWGINKLNKIS